MKAALFLTIAGLVGLGLLSWFVHLERAGRRIVPVLVILGLLVIESVLYPSQNTVPGGFFHPTFGGNSFRLPDLLIPLALAARVLGGGRRLRLHASSLWWLAFMSWLFAAGVMGIRRGNSSTLVTFEGKAIIYTGFFLLVAGVPISEFARGRDFRRFIFASALLAAFAIALSRSGVLIAFSVPGLQVTGMGPMGADGATVFTVLGLIAAGIGICSDTGRLWLLLAAVPLLFSPIVADQRAALIAMGVGLGLLAVFAFLGRRRVKSTPTELALSTAVFLTLLFVPVLGAAVTAPQDEPAIPFVDTVTRAFNTQAKRLSAEDRLNQWTQAEKVIREHPLIGSGLGRTYDHYDPGFKVWVTTDITHNIGLDLLMRAGAIGLALFLIAFVATTLDGLRVWDKHDDSIVAAVALACTCAMIGLVSRGLVESIFEKFRLATMLGFAVGVVASATLSVVRPVTEERTEHVRIAVRRVPWM